MFRSLSTENGVKIDDPCHVNEQIEVNTETKSQKFELISTIQHIGKHANCGHYVSFRKFQNKWLKCDDSTIMAIERIQQLELSCLFIYKRSINS